MRYCVVVLLAALSPLVQAETGFANLERGPHGVGFRVMQQYDYSRAYREKNDVVTGLPFTGERARPVQTLIWYPAAATPASSHLPYSDYLRTEATDDHYGRPQSEVRPSWPRAFKPPAARLATRRPRPNSRSACGPRVMWRRWLANIRW